MTRKLLALLMVVGGGTAEAEPSIGVTLDAGVPDGAGASIVYRPISRIRLHAGATHNLVSTGARAGVTLAPFRTWFSPTLSFDAGHYKDGDANVAVRMVTGDATFNSPVLERFGYSYANAHLGLEFGRKRATFFLHAGASYIATRIHNLGSEGDATSVTFTTDPAVSLLTVSARLGLIVYFL